MRLDLDLGLALDLGLGLALDLDLDLGRGLDLGLELGLDGWASVGDCEGGCGQGGFVVDGLGLGLAGGEEACGEGRQHRGEALAGGVVFTHQRGELLQHRADQAPRTALVRWVVGAPRALDAQSRLQAREHLGEGTVQERKIQVLGSFGVLLQQLEEALADALPLHPGRPAAVGLVDPVGDHVLGGAVRRSVHAVGQGLAGEEAVGVRARLVVGGQRLPAEQDP
ncbi:MAG: hypothetical protein GY884_06890, partial [Proteobacteria bacterium]|nr:hypothetical protein [Pseudomonadota bacterium]